MSRQCPSTAQGGRGRHVSVVFCVKREGHDGDHRGDRAQWNNDRRVPITESLEDARKQR